MNNFKKLTIVMLISLNFTNIQAGGVPVSDGIKIVNDKMHQELQVVKWGKEIVALKNQITEMKNQLEAIKGKVIIENLITAADSEEMHKLYPDIADMSETLKEGTEFYKEMKELKTELENFDSSALFGDRLSSTRTWYEERGKELFANLKIMQDGNKKSVENRNKILNEILPAQIKLAEDPKVRETLAMHLQLEQMKMMSDLITTIQTSKIIDLKKEVMIRNEWAREKQITTKVEDVKYTAPTD